MTTWVEYKAGSPIQEAIAVVKGLEAQGRSVIYMHQGAEETAPNGELARYFTYDGSNSPAYNPASGSPDIREACAGFAKDFLGLPATRENTYFLQSNGRALLGDAFHFANDSAIRAKLDPVGLAPALRWPMVDDKARQAHTRTLIEYATIRNGLAGEVEKALQSGTEAHQALTFAYFNNPHNPTGYLSNREEGTEIVKLLNEYNRHDPAHRLVLVDDNPYFASLPQKDQGAILAAPFEGIAADGLTPSFHAISFSKSFGTARPGASFVVITDSKIAKEFGKFLSSGFGPSYDEKNVANLAALMQPDNYGLIKNHLAGLNKKYTVNFNAVSAHLEQHLLDGDPGMVCTIRVPEDALNKLVSCADGVKRAITSGRHVAEYIANTHGVMTVDQSAGKEVLLRLALKSEDSGKMAEASAKIAQAYAELQNAPSLAV